MLKKVRIRIVTNRYEMLGTLFGENGVKPLKSIPKPEHSEMTVEGALRDDGSRISITYHETDASGMAGASTSISFGKDDPGLITMTRTGSVKTSLVFEKGRRHTCCYQTPVMPFEVCVYTTKVENAIEKDGTLTLFYTVELRGAAAEKTTLTLSLLPVFDKPLGQIN